MKTGTDNTCSPLYIKLDHMMRPDALYLAQISKTKYFSILVSTKLYDHDGVPSEKADNDQYSTDFSKVYFSTNGKNVNPKKKKDRDTWDSVLLQYSNFQHVGSLRLHILLPRIQRKLDNKRSDKDPILYSHVLGNDVVIYVKPLNSSVLFNEDARELLAIVTYTMWMFGKRNITKHS